MSQAEERNNRLMIELRQVKENLDSKNQEIQLLISQREQVMREMRVLEEKGRMQIILSSELKEVLSKNFL